MRSKKQGKNWNCVLFKTGALAIAALALLVCFAAEGTVHAPPDPQKHQVSANEAWQRGIRLFEAQWNVLLAEPQTGNRAKWRALETDLRDLAKKCGQHLEEHMRRAGGGETEILGNAQSMTNCAPRDDVPGYGCYLFLGPKGVCRYVCAPIKKK